MDMIAAAALVVVLAGAVPACGEPPGATSRDTSVDTVSGLTPDPSLREIPPRGARLVPGARALLLGTFALLILLPFVPGLIEVYRPRDRYPLPVDVDYAKDPRYFGVSARAILAGAIDLDAVAPGEHEVVLSKPETVEVRDDAEMPAGETRNRVLAARGALRVGEGAVCTVELFARGPATVGADATLRTLSGGADADLGARVIIERWLDVDGNAVVGEGSRLGASAAAGGTLSLADGVAFSRLFGAPVATAGFAGDAGDPPPPPSPPGLEVDEIRTIADLAEYHDGDLTVAADAPRHRPLVIKGDLVLAPGATLDASARVHGDLRLEAGALVRGDIFVEGDAVLEAGARVRGNLFSQSHVRLARGVRIGRPGMSKSLIAKLGIEFDADVAVHGYVLTDGRGRVSCAGSS